MVSQQKALTIAQTDNSRSKQEKDGDGRQHKTERGRDEWSVEYDKAEVSSKQDHAESAALRQGTSALQC